MLATAIASPVPLLACAPRSVTPAVLYPAMDAGRHHLSPRQIALMGLLMLVVGIGCALLGVRSPNRSYLGANVSA